MADARIKANVEAYPVKGWGSYPPVRNAAGTGSFDHRNLGWLYNIELPNVDYYAGVSPSRARELLTAQGYTPGGVEAKLSRARKHYRDLYRERKV